ncbi:MAG: GTPase HflX [Deltaproteobacteria bacterium]|nr:GTPase HflX [Deltaproteobacteria bacterium]
MPALPGVRSQGVRSQGLRSFPTLGRPPRFSQSFLLASDAFAKLRSLEPARHKPTAVIVGVQLDGVDEREHQSSLAELHRLADTLGLKVIAKVTQRRAALAKAAVLGLGKLATLGKLTGGAGTIPKGPEPSKKKQPYLGHGDEDDDDDEDLEEQPTTEEKAKVVLVDHDLTPSQARNLERATGAEVMDRTGVILAIFHRHAKSREARLQVEIARLSYLAPRLRELGASKERQRGGIGGRGAGESNMELDRRKIRDRIAELRRELEAIESESSVRRQRRSDHERIALVGYTNAGKSSLMRALTGSEAYVADALFATLDTTVRALRPETRPKILVSDTVGFIKKLPHDLVASFRSTLDEAREAQLLLFVVDAADPAHESQLEVTQSVLRELGAGETPSLLVLNKIDKLSESEKVSLAELHPDAVMISAHSPTDVARLHAAIVAFFERSMVEREIFVPYELQRLVSEIHERGRVLSEAHDETGTRLLVRAIPDVLSRFDGAIARLSHVK